ncbi:DNA adenine methylase [uncultured Tateyamaria sp.]|uniref:DNA adenine methylase n=1 Tax=uncultured Tateyamaria sp. TaxID=455651 RepID=UPI0026070D93|nr:DNA adenine methylase [uncultured Tateyamaria sp.]
MSYPGGKNGAGVYQSIINQMPPHDVYIEAFLGGGAIMRNKRPARLNIGIDLDRMALAQTKARVTAGLAISDDAMGPIAKYGDARFTFEAGNAIEYLSRYRFHGGELVYCDPPYMHDTRKVLDLYNYEMTDADHAALLDVLCGLPCMVMLSGYFTEFYKDRLNGWHSIQFQAMTRGGEPATEWLWMNFAPPIELHDYGFLGSNFRERERIKRKKDRWTARLEKMPLLERQAMLAAIRDAWPAAASSNPAMLESDTAVSDDATNQPTSWAG